MAFGKFFLFGLIPLLMTGCTWGRQSTLTRSLRPRKFTYRERKSCMPILRATGGARAGAGAGTTRTGMMTTGIIEPKRPGMAGAWRTVSRGACSARGAGDRSPLKDEG